MNTVYDSTEIGQNPVQASQQARGGLSERAVNNFPVITGVLRCPVAYLTLPYLALAYHTESCAPDTHTVHYSMTTV